MKNLKQNPAYQRVRKTYRKARRKVLDKGKAVEESLIGYIETEVAPRISVAKFSSTDVEHQYYAKIASLKNVYAMLAEMERNNPYLDDREISHKLIAIGKVLDKKYTDKELRYFLALLAFNTLEDALTFSGLFWACIHTERYQDAAKILAQFSVSQGANPKQIESLKRALSKRLPKADIEQYIENSSQKISNHTKNTKLKSRLTKQENKYKKLINQKDYKAIADEVYKKFNSTSRTDEVLDFINLEFKANLKLPTKTVLLILINVGKKFAEQGRRDIEIDLVEEALSVKKYPLTVRSAFWAYYKRGNINKCREMLDWIEDYARSNNDSKQLEFVRSKRQTYLFIDLLYLQSLIDSSREISVNTYSPVPNSIAYVLHNMLPYASGGYATRAHGLASAIKDTSYRLTLIGRPGFPLDIRKELTTKDIELKQNIEGVDYSFTLEPRRDSVSTQEFIEKAAEALYTQFLEVRPAIVIAASNHLTGLPALIAARKLNIPFIYEVRGFWEITRISREPEFEHTELFQKLCDLETLVANNADHVFTLTTPMKEELVRRGINGNKVTILPNSCNPDRFEPKNRDELLASKLSIPTNVPVIGYIGTFVQYEGLEHLAEACGLLKDKGIEFRLLIVGNENTAGENKGPISEAIESIAHKFQFEDWLIMPGRVPHEEVEAYYSLIDIAPFPRKPQPVTEMVSPMKPLEAAAMKKAIVVSSVRALTDMITDGENGLVFEKGNVDDLARQLGKLIQNTELMTELGERARLWVENERTWKITANKMSELLDSIESLKN